MLTFHDRLVPLLAGLRRGPRTAAETLTLTAAAHEDLACSIGRLPAETGALLGGDPATGTITEVRFDAGATRSATTYAPDVGWLNRLLHDEWNPAGIRLLGMAHSHPAGIVRPSEGDLLYARRILAAIPDLERFAMPIVQTFPDTGRFALHPWVVHRNPPLDGGPELAPASLRVIDRSASVPLEWSTDPAFDRQAAAVSLPLLARCRLVVVGAGGSAHFVETMVRQGVGEVVLIDPDVVELPNLGSQYACRSDVGRTKVGVLARRLRDINPLVSVVPLAMSLDDLGDEALAPLASAPWPDRPHPEVVLWCGFTDDFWAQARVNRLALQHGQPMLAAQVYEGGRGAEVSFAAPGTTPACGRCVLGSRYRAWLDDGWSTPGRSGGSPLAATDRVNATKAQVALALLHGSAGPAWAADPTSMRWRRLLDLIARRNLALVRLDPDIADTLGLTAFDRAFHGSSGDRLAFDETIWLPQEPEREDTGHVPCGDCGGTGDLRDVVGSFADTRLAPIGGGR